MKKLILLLVILLVLGGGAAAVWWYFLKPKDETAQAEEPPPPPPVLTQIDLPLVSISVINGNKSAQRIDFLITVVFDDPEKEKKVEERMPRLFDAVNTELHGILPRKMVEQGGFQRSYLEERLTKAVAEKLGKGVVNKIYIKDMQVYK